MVEINSTKALVANRLNTAQRPGGANAMVAQRTGHLQPEMGQSAPPQGGQKALYAGEAPPYDLKWRRHALSGALGMNGFPTTNRVQELYRRIAPMYDLASPIWTRGYRAAYRSLERWLLASIRPCWRVLDLGCGTGANLGIVRRLALDFGSYLGVDQSRAMLGQARSKFGGLANVEFRQLDLQAGSLPQGQFDLVISTWVLEHLTRPEQVVESALKILTEDGRMLLLFEVGMRGWRQRVFGPIWRYFGAVLVSYQAASSFPGALTIERFDGPGPTVAVMSLGKQISPGGFN